MLTASLGPWASSVRVTQISLRILPRSGNLSPFILLTQSDDQYTSHGQSEVEAGRV